MDDLFYVTVIEDNKLFAENIESIIENDTKLKCNGIFENVENAHMHLKSKLSSDLLILDIGLPGIDGISAIRMFKEVDDKMKIIMFTVFDDDENIFKAAKEGANGYLLKGDSDRKILRSIHDVLEGGGALNAGVAAKMLKFFEKSRKSDKIHLTASELGILQYFSQGKTKREIAELVEKSIHTVDTHIRNIYMKLHVNSRAEAVCKAIKKGII